MGGCALIQRGRLFEETPSVYHTVWMPLKAGYHTRAQIPTYMSLSIERQRDNLWAFTARNASGSSWLAYCVDVGACYNTLHLSEPECRGSWSGSNKQFRYTTHIVTVHSLTPFLQVYDTDDMRAVSVHEHTAPEHQ